MSAPSSRHRAALDIATAAGAMALDFFARRSALALSVKGVLDVASEADRAVEDRVRGALADVFPGEALVGEETAGAAPITAERFWIVDPIDGTANFLRGNPLWSVALAHVTAGEPDLGVLHYPMLGLTLSAELGGGLMRDGVATARDSLFEAVPVAAVGENATWGPDGMGAVERRLREAGWGVAGYRSATVGLGFAALGAVDGYVEARTSLWDIAAGIVLCREAGLRVAFGGATVPKGLWIRAGTAAFADVLGAAPLDGGRAT